MFSASRYKITSNALVIIQFRRQTILLLVSKIKQLIQSEYIKDIKGLY